MPPSRGKRKAIESDSDDLINGVRVLRHATVRRPQQPLRAITRSAQELRHRVDRPAALVREGPQEDIRRAAIEGLPGDQPRSARRGWRCAACSVANARRYRLLAFDDRRAGRARTGDAADGQMMYGMSSQGLQGAKRLGCAAEAGVKPSAGGEEVYRLEQRARRHAAGAERRSMRGSAGCGRVAGRLMLFDGDDAVEAGEDVGEGHADLRCALLLGIAGQGPAAMPDAPRIRKRRSRPAPQVGRPWPKPAIEQDARACRAP